MNLLETFYYENGGKMNFCRATSCPPLAMLNSLDCRLFLKYAKPENSKNVSTLLLATVW